MLRNNNKFTGDRYDFVDRDAFGARVLVGYIPAATDIYGLLLLSNLMF